LARIYQYSYKYIYIAYVLGDIIKIGCVILIIYYYKKMNKNSAIGYIINLNY